MKIASFQLIPVFGDVEGSIAKIERLLEGVKPGDIDLLLLPELALAGYNFPSLEAIYPFLEISGEGPSSLWARKTAQRLKCIVCIGYAEKAHSPSTLANQTTPSGLDKSYNYNSNIMYSPEGEMIGHYRKNFLYMTDMTWCSESPANETFFAQEMPLPLATKMAFGICMDINPYQFLAPWNKFEFASHAREVEADLVAVSMAWSSFVLRPEDVLGEDKVNPDLETVGYWVQRFKPVVDAERQVLIVLGNRCGVEGETVYTGSSMVARVGFGRVEIFELLGKGEEKLLRVNTEKKPRYAWDRDDYTLYLNI